MYAMTMAIMLLFSAGSAFAQGRYERLQNLTVGHGWIKILVHDVPIFGTVTFSAEGEGDCTSLNFTINGRTRHAIHSSKWQRRDNAESPWTDIPGTGVTGEACTYSPTEPGEYRLVGEATINYERGRRASWNTFTVAGEPEEPEEVAGEPEEPEEEPKTTAVETATWGFIKHSSFLRQDE